jgi:hypothetical protein
MANWWDKNLTDKQNFWLQETQDASLLDVVANVPNPVGDVASGLLAAQDVSKGNYGTAALNALGLLPFVPSMGAVIKNSDTFEQLAKTGKMRQAKNKEQELNDLISGKSKFAEVRLNWDDPKTYDLADKLKAQGFDSTVTQQGKDMVTLFHKSAEDVSPVLNAKTPYDFGKAYGYTDNDIAAFYNNRYGKDAKKYWQQDSKFLPAKTDFEVKQLTAQRNAALPIAEGGLGLPVNNTAMDRANAMGYTTPAYHGTKDSKLQKLNDLFYSAENPTLANEYAKGKSDKFAKGSNTIPLLVNLGKNKQLNTAGEYEYQFMKSQDNVDMGEDPYYWYNEGYDSATHSLPEYPKDSTYLNFNPQDVRSRFAAFDPMRRNEADILAGVAPLAVGSLLGLNTYNNMQEKPKKEKKK